MQSTDHDAHCCVRCAGNTVDALKVLGWLLIIHITPNLESSQLGEKGIAAEGT